MHDHTTPAPASRDNLLGFCHAIGNALGFNPIYLRLVLAALLLVSVETALLGYAACGAIVLAERLLAWSVRPRRWAARA